MGTNGNHCCLGKKMKRKPELISQHWPVSEIREQSYEMSLQFTVDHYRQFCASKPRV